ncbi:unnamed protein product [Bursaphelenchus xylophilus]|uniref:(pine wood nematode) hypothetical protein n=1 Tax=Bursaphelenchus xylophilus TaxID=6326 RepID=A0A1I7SS82_BURXY|nr:unnamed protein product [Bursaphelenchus xylophilus]CAG9097940.1 unnamed protein product [Bursaphelenchus xylophilus]
MEFLTLKIILLVFMGIVPFVFALIPLQLYKVLVKSKGRLGKNAETTISLLSCFCGGVILGVCLIEMLPDAREDWEKAKGYMEYESDYPYVELLTGVGFFIVYFVEEFLNQMCGLKHDHEDEGVDEVLSTFDSDFDEAPENVRDKRDADLNPLKDVHSKKGITNVLAFVLALVFHTSLEGFAFGVQRNVISMSSLFFGIITHKALVAFSFGMNLAKHLSHNKILVVILVCIISLSSPVGGMIGILIENSEMDATSRFVVSTILTSFSVGTFIYIAFFEVLAPEHANHQPPLLKWGSCCLGYFTMAGFLAYKQEE